MREKVKKHLFKIVLFILFAGSAAVGVVFSILHPVEKEAEQTAEYKMGDIIFAPEDYTAGNNEELYINKDNYFHYDQTTIRGVLKEIAYKNGELDKFIIEAPEGSIYEISYSDLDLISIKTGENEGGKLTAELIFRTGGSAELTVGKDAMLYKTYDDAWSLDIREHVTNDKLFFTGKIEDFVFLPVVEGDDKVYLSYIVVVNEQGERAEVYANSIYGASIMSLQPVDIYYVGSTAESRVFDVKEGGEYKIELKTRDKIYTLQKGMQINLVQRVHNGYWEIYHETDSLLHEAKVEGFTFGDADGNIASLDYINLVLSDGERIQMTMSQTGALYAVPYGDYTKIYTYFGHEKVLTNIEVSEDWKLEVYFENDIMLELSIGSTVWVRQNEDGIWQLEYTHNDPASEEIAEN